MSENLRSDFDKFHEEAASYTILVDSVAVGMTEYIDSVPLNGIEYYYWIQAIGATGDSKKVAASNPTFVNVVPKGFIVYPPYPNPFNPSTTIRHEIPKDAHVEIVVYDILGRKVKILENRYRIAGAHDIV